MHLVLLVSTYQSRVIPYNFQPCQCWLINLDFRRHGTGLILYCKPDDRFIRGEINAIRPYK